MKSPVFVPTLLPGRAMEEQLCELTRLVLRLPEVDSLLQRAGLQPTVTRLEPTSVLEMFVKVTCSLVSNTLWSVNSVSKGQPCTFVYLDELSRGFSVTCPAVSYNRKDGVSVQCLIYTSTSPRPFSVVSVCKTYSTQLILVLYSSLLSI